MKRFLVFAAVLSFFAIYAFSVCASPVEVSVEPKEQEGQLYSISKFRLTIWNNQNFHDSFQIVFSGPHLEWLMPSRIAQGVDANSYEENEVVFYPTGANKGKFEFTVSVNSLKNPNVKASESFVLDIPYDVSLKSLTAEASGNSINFVLKVKSPEEKTVKGVFSLKDASGKSLGSVSFEEKISGDGTITRILSLGEILSAGTYTAEAETDEGMRIYSQLSVSPVRNMIQTVEETSGLLVKEVKISIYNAGNVLERNYPVQHEMPIDFMTGLMTKPDDNCREESGKMICNYIVSEIKPGSTAQVTYTVNQWPALNGYIILTIIVISLVLYSFLRVTTPQIIKRHSKRDEKYNISIHIRNPFFRTLKDVIVKDRVSPLVQVLHEEIESTPPVIRKAEEGTELIWKIGEMKPREERILQYKVKPLVHGHLKMPKAHLKFSSGKDEKKLRVFSNAITLE